MSMVVLVSLILAVIGGGYFAYKEKDTHQDKSSLLIISIAVGIIFGMVTFIILSLISFILIRYSFLIASFALIVGIIFVLYKLLKK